MKKIFSILFLMIMLFSLVACHQDPEPTTTSSESVPAPTESVPSSEPVETQNPDIEIPEWTGERQLYVDGEPYNPENHELKDPIVNYKAIVPGMINKFVMEIENPNDTNVACSYEVFFYQNNEEIGSAKGLFTTSLGAGAKTILYSEWQIPENASEIKENLTFVVDAKRAPEKCEITEKDKKDDELSLLIKKISDGTPVLTVTFYNEGKITEVRSQTLTNETELTYRWLKPFDSYQVYINTN